MRLSEVTERTFADFIRQGADLVLDQHRELLPELAQEELPLDEH
jgi:hypothetical protein